MPCWLHACSDPTAPAPLSSQDGTSRCTAFPKVKTPALLSLSRGDPPYLPFFKEGYVPLFSLYKTPLASTWASLWKAATVLSDLTPHHSAVLSQPTAQNLHASSLAGHTTCPPVCQKNPNSNSLVCLTYFLWFPQPVYCRISLFLPCPDHMFTPSISMVTSCHSPTNQF